MIMHILTQYSCESNENDISSHFMKLFKDLTGMSFTAYLVNYRLEIAAKQLKETSSNIIDISTNCGFNNHSYFTRAFKKKYGTSPLKYKTALT